MTRTTGLTLALLAILTTLSPAALTSLIDQGRAAIGRGDDDAAIALFKKAVAQSPKSAEAHFCLGGAYGSKVQKVGIFGAATYAPLVKGEFETAVALDPNHVEARFALVQVYAATPEMMGGSIDKALEQAKAIKAIDPVVGHRAYAVVYSQQSKPDLAKQEYVAAIAEQPGSPKAHSFFGQYLVNVEKNYAAAAAEFESALKVDPGYMPAFYHLGRTAALADTNFTHGEASLKKYLGYSPKPDEPPLANAHYWLGAIYEKAGRKAEAKQSYEAALKLNPTLKLALEAMKRLS